MINARSEFIEHVLGKTVMCARILKEDFTEEKQEIATLQVGFNEAEYRAFLDKLNFEYDDGYGTQELLGNIWYRNGTWSERYEYDGSEEWKYKQCPQIPSKMVPSRE